MIESFHFLRPWWLLLILPLSVILWMLLQRRFDSASWRSVVDARLIPHVLTGGAGRTQTWMRWIFAAVTMIAIVALAGPTWEKVPQPVYHKETALVIALDLSRSMDATDIKPSRLARARHKIADILNLRQEGQTALVVYAADAFTVTPLTTDVDTILALLPVLESGLMPAQGTRADRALQMAFELFRNSGIKRGDVLLISDGFSDLEATRIEQLLNDWPGHRLSVLAVGTPDGAPIPLSSGGFLKDRDGTIVIADIKETNLRRIAQSGGGVYASISVGDIDINTLSYLMESSIDDREARLSDQSADLWRELGPGLLLLVLPLAALAFRRGLLWVFPMFFVLLPPDASALDWQPMWQNDNQRARQLFEQGEHAAAADKFDNPSWQGSSRYRAGDFEGALESWRALPDEAAMYNRGNALARSGQFEAALESYEKLLQQNPDHEDARFNKQAIEEWLENQQQQDQSQSDQQSGESSQDAQNNQNGQSQGSDGDSTQSETDGQAEQDPAQSPQRQSEQQAQSQEQQQSQEQTEQALQDATDDPAEAGQQAEARLDQQMSEQAAEQWLRKVPDDPGGLLRRKFVYQYRKRGGVDAEGQSW